MNDQKIRELLEGIRKLAEILFKQCKSGQHVILNTIGHKVDEALALLDKPTDKPCTTCGGSGNAPERIIENRKSVSQNCLHRPECAINKTDSLAECTCDGPKAMPCLLCKGTGKEPTDKPYRELRQKIKDQGNILHFPENMPIDRPCSTCHLFKKGETCKLNPCPYTGKPSEIDVCENCRTPLKEKFGPEGCPVCSWKWSRKEPEAQLDIDTELWEVFIEIDDIKEAGIVDAVRNRIAQLQTRIAELKEKAKERDEVLFNHIQDKKVAAVKRVGELEAKLKALDWIPVNERLPEKEGIYLTKYKGDGRQHLDEKNWIRSYHFMSIFKKNWSYKRPTKYSVTHWMPIPTLPEDK